MSDQDQDHEPAQDTARKVRRPRLRGEERDKVRAAAKKDYDGGASIRDVAAEHNVSFGLARTLLLEADVELRTRRRRTKAAEQ
jgi:Helix-turn-helix domain